MQVADQRSKDVRDMRDYSRRQPRDFFLGAGSRAATIACGENGRVSGVQLACGDQDNRANPSGLEFEWAFRGGVKRSRGRESRRIKESKKTGNGSGNQKKGRKIDETSSGNALNTKSENTYLIKDIFQLVLRES